MKKLELRQIIREEIKKTLNEGPNSDVRQRFIDLVQSRIDSLEKDLKTTKQGHQYYERIQERIDELNDLLGEMKNVV